MKISFLIIFLVTFACDSGKKSVETPAKPPASPSVGTGYGGGGGGGGGFGGSGSNGIPGGGGMPGGGGPGVDPNAPPPGQQPFVPQPVPQNFVPQPVMQSPPLNNGVPNLGQPTPTFDPNGFQQVGTPLPNGFATPTGTPQDSTPPNVTATPTIPQALDDRPRKPLQFVLSPSGAMLFSTDKSVASATYTLAYHGSFAKPVVAPANSKSLLITYAPRVDVRLTTANGLTCVGTFPAVTLKTGTLPAEKLICSK